MVAGVLTQANESPLLATLLRAVPQIHARLADRAAWNGFRVQEPDVDAAYLRVVCVDDLVATRVVDGVTVERKYRPAIHLFAQTGYEGKLHDHRWPIAVLPFDLQSRPRQPLYEMPWQVRDGERGRMIVRHAEPWAIEACSDVLHGVKSLAPHLSITLADLTEPARRENRMVVDSLTDDEVHDLLRRAAQIIPSRR